MKKALISISFLLFICFFFSCSSKSEKKQKSYSSKEANHNKEKSKKKIKQSSEGEFEDGTYSATVDYKNSKTGHSATYTLDVDVEDGQVVQINFPNGGWMDEDHFEAKEIDKNGEVIITDDRYYEYTISHLKKGECDNNQE